MTTRERTCGSIDFLLKQKKLARRLLKSSGFFFARSGRVRGGSVSGAVRGELECGHVRVDSFS